MYPRWRISHDSRESGLSPFFQKNHSHCGVIKRADALRAYLYGTGGKTRKNIGLCAKSIFTLLIREPASLMRRNHLPARRNLLNFCREAFPCFSCRQKVAFESIAMTYFNSFSTFRLFLTRVLKSFEPTLSRNTNGRFYETYFIFLKQPQYCSNKRHNFSLFLGRDQAGQETASRT